MPASLPKLTFRWPAASLLATLFVAFALLGGCDSGPTVASYSGPTMGTTFTVKWVAEDADSAERIGPLLEQSLAAVNQSMSTYIEDSELSRLNREPAGSTTAVSAGLFEVLRLSQQISETSDGAFDVTVGPLVNLWGFGPDGRVTHAPDQARIDATRERVGFRKLHLDPNGRRVTKDGPLYVDLSGIAKGYGVDQLAQVLEGQGIDSYLVEVGGELRARGQKPDGTGWRIAVESPVAGERDVQRIIEVHEIGVATSGDYRNYFEENGIRFSHTIDPATGRPISHKLASVTVLSPTCAEADGLATMFTVMGPERGFKYAVDNGVAAFFIVKSDEGFVERMTPAFEPYLTE